MRVVLIDSPGAGPESHWSVAFADSLGEVLRGAGVAVDRLRSTSLRPVPLHRVSAAITDVPREIELARSLRRAPADVVVHAGVGARGSQNLLWIAERMGSGAVAVARASEVVCHRGDLVDREGKPCRIIDDPDHCARCCSLSFVRRSGPGGFRARLDLVLAGLLVCERIWLADDDDPALLERIGVSRRLIASAPRDELAAAVAASLRDVSARDPAS